MQLRTDLALEAREFVDEKEEGVVVKEEQRVVSAGTVTPEAETVTANQRCDA